MGYFSLQTPLSRKLLFFVRPVLCGTIYVVCFNMQSLFFLVKHREHTDE